MISFAGGMPAPEIFPVDSFFVDSSLLKAQGADVMQYGTTEGDLRLRRFIAEWQAARLGRIVGDDEIILTTGSQQALDLLGWALIDEGDTVIVEDPTYLSALSVFVNHGANLAPVPLDGEGLMTDHLPGVIERLKLEGQRLKLIYTIVNFQNPSGATMQVARRRKLAEISERYGVPVIEDDPYGYIRYDGEHLPSIFSFHGSGGVVYCSSFSKVLSPGTRIGWALGESGIIRQLAVFKQFADLCSSPITQTMTYEYCKNGYLDAHLPVIINNYRVKRGAMEESMMRHLSPLGVTWAKPEGGFFFWLDFGGIDSSELARRALDKKVAFIPSRPFRVDKANADGHGRVNFTYSSPDIIEEGTLRLAEAGREMKI
jgi:2-aminoadipate transaminase